MTHRSQLAIVLDLLKEIPISAYFELAWRQKFRLLALLKKDFAAASLLLAELSYLAHTNTKSAKKTQYPLHQQLSDTALFINRPQMISDYLLLAARYQFTPVLITANPERFLLWLGKIPRLPKNICVVVPKISPPIQQFASRQGLKLQENTQI